MIAWRRLRGGPEEVGISADLLLAPRFIRQGGDAIGKYLGHSSGPAHGGDNRPKRIVARGVQADGFNHAGKLARFLAKIKRQSEAKAAAREKRRCGRGIGHTAES